MLPEQQQRILGYFIEEARDHLNTIEQGLLNLQSTLNDPEMLNEVFRAAHSIKGGAAMLGLSSIQHTAHRLEDCFKVLKEHPVRVDEKLESLFLGVADTLKALLEHLSGPFGLSEEAASTLMSEAEPVFKWLNEHLELLVQQGHHGATDEGEKTILQPPTTERVGSLTEIFWRGDTAAPPESSQNPAPLPVSAAAPVTPADNWSEFQNQVLQVLREMLQLFKQQATSESRQSLQKCCRQLEKLGQQWNLPHWCDLCQAAANAIGNYENTYLTLAKIVITEIKQAQELILQGREAEIAVSQQLEALLTLPELDLFDLTLGLFDYEQPSVTAEAPATRVSTPEEDEVLALIETVQPADSVTSLSDLTEQLNQQPDAIASDNIDNAANSFISGEDIPLTVSRIDHHGPEVGLAELNTLADLFEGETQELDETWEQVEILDISAVNELEIDLTEIPTEDSDSDLADFLSLDEAATNDQTATNFNQTEDLGLLFGDHFLEKENIAAETTINAAEDLPQFAIQSSTQESVEDLFTLDQQKLDSRESESAAVNHISATQQSILDELFLENPETNLPGESHPQEDIEDWQQTVFQPYTFENLFTDSEENVLIPTDNLEIGDLFDTPTELTTDFAQADEDLSSFWNSSEEGEAQPELDVVLPEDVAKALEESLFAAAASGEIFVELQESNSSISEDYRDDFELTFLQPDIEFNSESQDDLFGELMAPNFGKESNLPLPEMPNLTQPEALELAPEFTTPEASIEELELKVAEKQQIPLNELEMPIHGTYIQLDSFDNPSLDFLANVGFEEGNVLSTEPEIEAVSVNEIAALENIDIVSLDELLSTDINQQDVDLEQLIAETEIIDFSQLLLPEDDTPALFDNLLLIDNSQVNETVESKVDDNFELFLTEFTPPPDASLAELIAENNTEDQGIKLEIYENINETIAVDVLRETADSPEILLETSDIPKAQEEQANSILAELAVSEPEDIHQISEESENQDEFADLEALLSDAPPLSNSGAIASEDFAALEALLGGANHNLPQQPSPEIHNTYIQEFPTPTINPLPAKNTNSLPKVEDEFSDLEKLLADADQNISPTSPVKPNANKSPRPANRRNARFEETMKVPVKQLDDMSNLVGELVVNRNTLEQDHERLRQSLDNLLIQVQQLSDVGARMQELYERSLLEASLLASRKTREAFVHSNDSHTDRGFSPEEMDRFTPFHTLSQEMIELIVRVRESASDIDFVTEETERVARQFRQVTTQLQEGLTRARMVPFSQAIDRLRRGVRDNAIKCGKQIELVIEGGDTLIDKMILDHLTDPLTHMLNNAIAHGIETPEERQLKGKPPVGEITIRAFHQGNQTVISVGDNGAGIDSEKVKVKAVKVGMITPEQAKTISRMEVYDLLFQPGFSIKDKADEISGRGVGMDVVRSEISEIRGTVNTDSVLGKGTTFTIRLPLTLSICKALCCVSDKARIAFPMDGVEDTLDVPAKNIQHNTDGQSFISWRDTVLPFRPLKELLSFNRQLSRGNVYGGTRDDDTVSVVVVRSGNTLIALQIDLVLSEQEIVIKQFEGPAPKPIGVAGATVLGDGRIMPIADVLEIIDIFQGRISKNTAGSPWQQKVPPTITETPAEKIDPTVLIVDDSITVRELLSLTFNKAGYRVEQARDGQEAWDKLRSGLPCDIVFCDIEMPRCDGLELLSRIQKDTSLNHLPIAMLTSRGADKHRQMAIQLGASGYFTKPYLEEALLEAAVRMLKGEKLVSSI
ncbi:response regulator [Nostoc sp. FACHB-110]|uniref:hybrid sensor histidine kinase/response regulator n=1 Tax=Nostoc sp. FACHB-110 TaxID=2692834 RepID=UPI0016831997|nr:response regulator [Nostoc sp. FACHB-110]MBD2437262.1 response regulator [Nostoc sp. FACHB-110]